jgi:uncharacterized protein
MPEWALVAAGRVPATGKLRGLLLCPTMLSGLLLAALPARAGWDEGAAAFQQGEHAEAERQWGPLADQGDPNALLCLIAMYNRGEGIGSRDSLYAPEKWTLRWSAVNSADAQHRLGVLFLKGEGVPQDFVEAHRWFNLAAANEPPGDDRDRFSKSREAVAGKMTPAQIAEAQKLAREWRPGAGSEEKCRALTEAVLKARKSKSP